MTNAWTYTRLYTLPDGNSAFEDVTIELEDAGPIGYLSSHFDVDRMVLRHNGPDYDYDFHNAPARQFVLMLEGLVDIETSRGECRRLRAGDVLFVEDVDGKGHRSRAVDGQPRRSIFVTLKSQN